MKSVMSKICKIVSMIVGISVLSPGLVQANPLKVEDIYHHKISALNNLPNTYVVGSYIGDFNNDGIKDLLVSTWEVWGEINNIIYTYKNNKMIRLNDEIKIEINGRHHNYQVYGVGTKDGKESLIKVIREEGNRGEGYMDVKYYKLGKDNKLDLYIQRNNYNSGGSLSELIIKDEYYKEGKQISGSTYLNSTAKYSVGKQLYVTVPDCSNEIITKADRYNKSERIYFEDETRQEKNMMYYATLNYVE